MGKNTALPAPVICGKRVRGTDFSRGRCGCQKWRATWQRSDLGGLNVGAPTRGALPCRNHHEPGQPQGLPLHLDHLNRNATPGLTQDDCKVLFHPLMVSLSNHQPPERASFDKLRMSGKNGYVVTLQSSYGLTRTHFATVAVPGKRQFADTAPLPLLPTRPYYLTTNHHFNSLFANRPIAQLQTPPPGSFGFQNPNRHPQPRPPFPTPTAIPDPDRHPRPRPSFPTPTAIPDPDRHSQPQPSFPRKRESRNSSGQSTFLFGNPTGFRIKSGMTGITERPKSPHRSVKAANIAPKTCSIHPHDLPKSLLK